MENRFLCKICSSYSSHTYIKVLRHIGAVHSFDPNFTITCGLDGCIKIFSKYTSFRKHIIRNHRHILSPQDTRSCELQLQGSVSTCGVTEDDQSKMLGLHASLLSTTHEMTQEAMPFSLQSITVSPTYFNMHQAAMFLLKAKECLKVSQTALNALISDIDTLLHLQLEAVKDKVLNLLSSHQIPDVLLDEVNDVFDAENSPFLGLESEYSQNKFFIDHLGLVVQICMF